MPPRRVYKIQAESCWARTLRSTRTTNNIHLRRKKRQWTSRGAWILSAVCALLLVSLVVRCWPYTSSSVGISTELLVRVDRTPPTVVPWTPYGPGVRVRVVGEHSQTVLLAPVFDRWSVGLQVVEEADYADLATEALSKEVLDAVAEFVTNQSAFAGWPVKLDRELCSDVRRLHPGMLATVGATVLLAMLVLCRMTLKAALLALAMSPKEYDRLVGDGQCPMCKYQIVPRGGQARHGSRCPECGELL